MYANSAVKVYEKDKEDYIYILMPLGIKRLKIKETIAIVSFSYSPWYSLAFGGI